MTDAARARRSGNPAVRAAVEDEDNVTQLEQEADGGALTFEFAGETWSLVDGFKPLRYQRISETAPAAGLAYALGDEQYEELEDLIVDVDEIQAVSKAISDLLGGQGNSRASRRSSARQRPARR